MEYVLIIYVIISLIVMYKTVNVKARLTLFEHLKQLLTPFAWIAVVVYNFGVWLIWVKNNW